MIYVEFGLERDKLEPIVALAKERGWKLQGHEQHLGTKFKPDGALLHSLPDSRIAKKIKSIGCPAVRIGRYENLEDHQLPVVLPDLTATGRIAAEHFAQRQYKNVAFVGFTVEEHTTDLNPLYKSFLKSCRDLKMNCKYVSTNYRGVVDDSYQVRQEKKEKIYLELINNMPKPIALLSTIDLVAWQICEVCVDNNLKVPEDVAILTYGNDIGSELTPISLSSIDPGYETICRQAMDLLQNLMNGESAPDLPIFVSPSRIIDRESTDVLASSDPIVSKALRFMWDNLEKDVTVEDVIKAVGVSRSNLNRKLQVEIGRGVVAELRRKRLEYACDLLNNSDLTNVEIAKKSGFKTKSYLQRVFLEEIGMTPLEYRKQHLIC